MSFIRLPRVLAAAAIALGILSASAAVADDALDTTKVPRIASAKELFAFPQSTAYITTLSVPEALTSVSTALAGDGWQGYVPAFSSQVANPQLAIAQFKKDRQILSVMITIAPAQNNATSVSYTALVNAHDLPFPKDASHAEYDPERPYLACASSASPEALSTELRDGLKARGWLPWSPETGARVDNADRKTDKGLSSFYVSDNHPPLHLSLTQVDNATKVVIESISPEVLAKAAKTASAPPAEKKPESVAKSEPEAATAAGKPAEDAFDNLSKDIMAGAKAAIDEALSEATGGKAGKKHPVPADDGEPLKVLDSGSFSPAVPIALPEGSEDISYSGGKLEFTNSASVQQIAAFYRSAMKPLGWREEKTPVNKANMAVLEFKKSGKDISMTVMRMGEQTMVTAAGSALEQEESAAEKEGSAESSSEPSITADKLEAEDAGGLIIPSQHTSSGTEKSVFRVSANAHVQASMDEVLKFYRREIGKLQGWSQSGEKTVSGESAEVRFTTPDGPAVLSLKQSNGETDVVLALRKTQEALKSGLMPKSGQVRILIGNVMEKDATLNIGKKSVKVAAGVGSKAPDGPSLELAPGKYKFTAKGPGVSPAPEEVSVGADEIWGLMIGPGGILPVQLY